MKPLATLLCALALQLASAPARAASYDPELTWRTLETEHFNITFHGGLEQLAEEVALVAEPIHEEMSAELKWAPRRKTEVVLIDHTDSANGYATTLPVNTIVIFVTAPMEGSTLSLYEDWSDAILTHEYTHILHLDTIEALPALLRYAMGRIISVNRISPGWIVEGQATFQETRHTNGGRGRSPTVDMIKRVAVLEDEFPKLGAMDGFQFEPPGGNLRYLFGQDFAQYVSDTTGEDVWTDYFHTYGGGIPYLLPARKVMGQPFRKLYKGWKAELEKRYEAQAERIRAQGLTPFTLLSDGEQQCVAPVWSPAGDHIVWSCYDLSKGANVFLADGQGADPEVMIKQRYATDFTWRADGRALTFSGMHTVNRFNLYSDVYLYTLGGGLEALTSGKRARNPALSPDGRELIVITNKAQNNQLARLTVDRKLEPLTEHSDHTQLSTPRWSPDGRSLALSVWRDGQRDLWIYSPEGEPLRRITQDIAQDQDPAWSPDGRTLYFASDRSGVWNIYAVDLATERLYQVSNVLGGAWRPSVHPDGDRLAFESYSNNGPDIALMSLDRHKWWDLGLLPSPLLNDEPLAQFIPQSLPERPKPAPKDKKEPKKGLAGIFDQESRQLRQEERQRKLGPVPGAGYADMVDPLPLPGLTGVGAPYHLLSQQPGPWGLPGEGAATGEFPDEPVKGPDARDSISVEEKKEEEDYPFTHPVGRYRPLPTLLPPRFLFPAIYRSTGGYVGMLSTGGSDLLRRTIYNGWASYHTGAEALGGGASIAYNRYLPVFTAGAYTWLVPYGDIFELDAPDSGAWLPTLSSTSQTYWDRRIRGYGQIWYSLDEYTSVYGGWSGTVYQPLRPELITSSTYRPWLPTRGYLSSLSAGWNRSRGMFYGKSISMEEARSLNVVGELFSPLLGSYVLDDLDQPVPFTRFALSAEWREYQLLPWAHNHVLAGKFGVGLSGGDEQRYGSYRLGGDFGEGSYYTTPDEWRALRGFEPATVYGDWYYLGSLEYRLPIAYPQWGGPGAFPFWAHNISGAAFIDAGNAFTGPSAEEGLANTPLVGTGLELRALAVLGWGIGLQLRGGYAFALVGDGYALGSTQGFYAWLGSSF